MKVSILGLVLAAGLAGQATAQVGHDPSGSPYRDLKFGQFVTLTAGQVFGSGGKIGVGPHRGRIAILRHDFLADRPLSLALGAGYARLDRNYVVLGAIPDRLRGPVKHDVYFAEGTLQLNLTGGKTWHGLAPYVGTGFGLAFAEKVAADTTTYRFGTKFYLAPAVGVRAFITRRLFLKVEARTTFWNLTYPDTYRADPDGVGPLDRLISTELKEWISTPVIHAGLGFAFHRPFF